MEIKKLDDLNVKELQALCTMYGIEVVGKNSPVLRKELLAGTSIDPENVEIPDDLLEEGDKRPRQGRIRVIFPNGEGPDGTGFVKITVNGYRYRCRREEPVDLPPEALHVIDNAVVEEIYRDESGVYQSRFRKRFVYQKV